MNHEDDIILSATVGEDTLTIGNIDLSDILSDSNTIDLSNMASSGTFTLTGSGGAGYSYSNGNWATTAASVFPTVYTLANTSPGIKIQGDADVEGDLVVQGISVVQTLKSINERLAILVPDPKRLEKYQALKQAYDHYKTLEALCIEQDDPDPKK